MLSLSVSGLQYYTTALHGVTNWENVGKVYSELSVISHNCVCTDNYFI